MSQIMKREKLLIATTNVDKAREIKHFLEDLPFELITLNELDEKILPPEESGKTLQENAVIKAQYYGEKTGLITLSEDTGFFIRVLDSWPGIEANRIGKNNEERQALTLAKMKDVPVGERDASVKLAVALYDSQTRNTFTTFGETFGSITTEPKAESGFGFDPIFFVDSENKTFAEMTEGEKNAVSHRGKALNKIKYFLQNQYGAKHIVVALPMIIRDGKLLITLRNDPHRAEAHRKWEFPGGIIDFGETGESTAVKEAKEEAGMMWK